MKLRLSFSTMRTQAHCCVPRSLLMMSTQAVLVMLVSDEIRIGPSSSYSFARVKVSVPIEQTVCSFLGSRSSVHMRLHVETCETAAKIESFVSCWNFRIALLVDAGSQSGLERAAAAERTDRDVCGVNPSSDSALSRTTRKTGHKGLTRRTRSAAARPAEFRPAPRRHQLPQTRWATS